MACQAVGSQLPTGIIAANFSKQLEELKSDER